MIAAEWMSEKREKWRCTEWMMLARLRWRQVQIINNSLWVNWIALTALAWRIYLYVYIHKVEQMVCVFFFSALVQWPTNRLSIRREKIMNCFHFVFTARRDNYRLSYVLFESNRQFFFQMSINIIFSSFVRVQRACDQSCCADGGQSLAIFFLLSSPSYAVASLVIHW